MKFKFEGHGQSQTEFNYRFINKFTAGHTYEFINSCYKSFMKILLAKKVIWLGVNIIGKNYIYQFIF